MKKIINKLISIVEREREKQQSLKKLKSMWVIELNKFKAGMTKRISNIVNLILMIILFGIIIVIFYYVYKLLNQSGIDLGNLPVSYELASKVLELIINYVQSNKLYSYMYEANSVVTDYAVTTLCWIEQALVKLVGEIYNIIVELFNIYVLILKESIRYVENTNLVEKIKYIKDTILEIKLKIQVKLEEYINLIIGSEIRDLFHKILDIYEMPIKFYEIMYLELKEDLESCNIRKKIRKIKRYLTCFRIEEINHLEKWIHDIKLSHNLKRLAYVIMIIKVIIEIIDRMK